ncbi:polyketide synthase dehydratase domain-containing protein, partial [Streptomyces sp. E11-3]|uniref:polyketide synthase dehydratase domain-containing protein n=1 Tax=Streptomyces sp. E11-3 TaxID=3110112 RepID=UPI00397EBA3E
MELPTYAFQHERYWATATAGAGNVTSAGLDAADHPLLGAAVQLADSDGVVLTGRISTATHPWLADHVIGGTVLFPGTGFVELAVRAGDQVGCDELEELTIKSPLALPDRGGVQVQVVVGQADASGARRVGVYSRAERSSADTPWVAHAEGLLTSATSGTTGTTGASGASGTGASGEVTHGTELAAWPPPGAEPIDIEGFYEEFTQAGAAYGPVFQGLTAAWRDGADLYAEVSLADQAAAARFGLHPAVLDAALHTVALTGAFDGPVLPFAWSDVRLHAVGASDVRVRLTSSGGEGVSLDVTDSTGQPVVSVGSLVLRPISAEQLAAARSASGGGLYRVAWSPVRVADGAGSAETAVWFVEGGCGVEGVRSATG